MSTTISACQQMRAMVDEKEYENLFQSYKYNHLNGGHYMTFGCGCTPPCYESLNITEEIVDEFNKKMAKDWTDFVNSPEYKDHEVVRMEYNLFKFH